MRQIPLFKAPRLDHGGGLYAGRRKMARPISPRATMHLVFRSDKAHRALSFLHPRNCGRVDRKVRELARRYGVQIHQYANAGNHLHILIKGRTTVGIRNFIRAIGSQVGQLVTGARKGRAFGKFWDVLAYSRIVKWGRAYRNAKDYVLKNFFEAEGFIDYVPRVHVSLRSRP